MSIRPIYLFGSDVLRAKARPVEELDADTIKLIADMVETMHNANGIGLAANQVGQLKRVIVINLGAVEEALQEESEEESASRPAAQQKTLVLINPEVLREEGSWKMEEGCLSIPQVRADVERAETIRVRFHDGGFRKVEMVADGLLARVILHEIDHLNGVLFTDRIGATQRTLLKGKLRKIKKGDVDASYPVVNGSSQGVRSAPALRPASRVKV
jgi:peptide deformylase